MQQWITKDSKKISNNKEGEGKETKILPIEEKVEGGLKEEQVKHPKTPNKAPSLVGKWKMEKEKPKTRFMKKESEKTKMPP